MCIVHLHLPFVKCIVIHEILDINLKLMRLFDTRYIFVSYVFIKVYLKCIIYITASDVKTPLNMLSFERNKTAWHDIGLTIHFSHGI